MTGYKAMSEWLKDMSLYRNHPDDDQLKIAIARRYNNATSEVKEQIKEHLIGSMLAKSDMEGLKTLLKGKTLVTKSKDDPWFEV